jgi:hypothetical protein
MEAAKESVVGKYKHNDGIPPITPGQRSGNSGTGSSDGSDD